MFNELYETYNLTALHCESSENIDVLASFSVPVCLVKTRNNMTFPDRYYLCYDRTTKTYCVINLFSGRVNFNTVQDIEDAIKNGSLDFFPAVDDDEVDAYIDNTGLFLRFEYEDFHDAFQSFYHKVGREMQMLKIMETNFSPTDVIELTKENILSHIGLEIEKR